MKLSEVRELLQLRPPILNVAERTLARCHSIEDLRLAAKRKLPKAVFDYVDGGGDAEYTMAANMAAFNRWVFHPRSLRDVSSPDLSVELFGRRLGAPLGLCPTGYTRMMHPGGEVAVAEASAKRGLPYCLSTVGTTSIEDLAATGHPSLWFQLYVLQDRGYTRSLVERAAAAGYQALEVCVDTSVPGNRVRDLRNGLTIPPELSARTIFDIGLHLGYWTSMLRSPMLRFANLVGRPDGVGPTQPEGMMDRGTGGFKVMFDPSLNWDYLEQVRGWWRGPLLIKGPISVEDAVRAAAAGVDGIHLSNHGGRQLDHTVPTLDLVRPAREAVADGVAILVDSGVRHGADIVVALARGADICMIGRPYLYGLAAAGMAGAGRALDLLIEEFRRTLQLLGVTSVAELRQHADTLVVSYTEAGAPLPSRSHEPA